MLSHRVVCGDIPSSPLYRFDKRILKSPLPDQIVYTVVTVVRKD